MKYPDLRAKMWQQVAILAGDNSASESVRVPLKVWDDSELARCVTVDMLSNADAADFAFEFAFLLNVLAAAFDGDCWRGAAAVLRENPSMAGRLVQDENGANCPPRSAELTAMAAC